MQPQKKITILLSVIVIAIALYCYNPFALYFQNDDFIHIPLTAQGVLLQHNTFRPVCDLSVMLDYRFYGTDAYGYHLTNLLLHILACVILFFLTRVMLAKYFTSLNQKNFYSFLSALLFFIYSSHSEAVFWILGRSAILGAIFCMLFLYGYLLKNVSKSYVVLYVTSLMFGLLSYESCWVLPVFSIILCFADAEKGSWKHALTVCGIFILYLFIRSAFIHEVAGSYEASAFINLDITALLKNYLLIVARSFLPAFNSNTTLLYFTAVFPISSMILFFYCKKKERKKIIFLSLFFLTSIVVYASIGIDTNGTEGERFLYFPTAITCMMLLIIIAVAKIKLLLKQVLICAFLMTHLTILFINADHYRFAGETTRLVISELQKFKNASTVHVSGLPQAQYGATIFRVGLPEAVEWLAKSSGIDTVIICSQRSELKPLYIPYKVRQTKDTTGVCNNYHIKDGSALRFTDSVLYIICNQ